MSLISLSWSGHCLLSLDHNLITQALTPAVASQGFNKPQRSLPHSLEKGQRPSSLLYARSALAGMLTFSKLPMSEPLETHPILVFQPLYLHCSLMCPQFLKQCLEQSRGSESAAAGNALHSLRSYEIALSPCSVSDTYLDELNGSFTSVSCGFAGRLGFFPRDEHSVWEHLCGCRSLWRTFVGTCLCHYASFRDSVGAYEDLGDSPVEAASAQQ